MKEQLAQHKTNLLDGVMVFGGAIYTTVSASLPIIIGILTAILFVIRIAIAAQEYRINKRKLDGIE